MERLLQLFVTGGDRSVLFEAIDQPFDLIAFPVGGAVEADAPAGFGSAAGNDRADAAAPQIRADRPAGVPPVADDPFGAEAGSATARPRHCAPFQQRGDLRRLMPLAWGHDDGDRLAAPFGSEMNRGAEAAARAAERLIAAPFLAPAALWCARIVVPSRKCSVQSSAPATSASAWSAANTRVQTPACCQRRQRLYTVCQEPYRSGRSRQGAPVARRHKMPFTMIRWSCAGRPVADRCGGSNGSSFAHWASVSSCRRIIHQGYHAFANTP